LALIASETLNRPQGRWEDPQRGGQIVNIERVKNGMKHRLHQGALDSGGRGEKKKGKSYWWREN